MDSENKTPLQVLEERHKKVLYGSILMDNHDEYKRKLQAVHNFMVRRTHILKTLKQPNAPITDKDREAFFAEVNYLETEIKNFYCYDRL